MTTTVVTALMYSGRPNPTWELTPDQVENLKTILGEKREVTMEMSSLSAGLLGYGGFIVESYESTLPTKAFFFDGIVDLEDQRQLNFIDKDSTLESFLLDTAETALSNDEKEFISGEISKNASGGPASRNKGLLQSFEPLAVPPFDPGKWNIPAVQPHNNCYNYANDKITNTFAQPGRGSGQTATRMLCADVSPAAQRDGQISVPEAVSTPINGHFIALVVAPDYDYHWYRLDANGLWSHKPGGTAARNTDNAGRLITDPRTCNRGPYTDFCGFFHCIPANTRIR